MSAGHDQCGGTNTDRKILWIALALNFPLFLIEIWQGLGADSTSLIADSMDFLSDSASYLITLYVLSKPLPVRAKAAIFKAFLMLLLAVAALGQGVHNIIHAQIPAAFTMGWVGILALAANIATAVILFKSRDKDSNMRSVWLCSRNDAIANICIIIAAFFVNFTGTLWPDLIVALVITWLEGSAALKIIAHAKQELKEHTHEH
jgi:Co/Zn/Cd efflux system component